MQESAQLRMNTFNILTALIQLARRERRKIKILIKWQLKHTLVLELKTQKHSKKYSMCMNDFIERYTKYKEQKR